MYKNPSSETVLAAKQGDRTATNEIVSAYTKLAYSMANTFHNQNSSGVYGLEDLEQEALMAILDGIRLYNPHIKSSFRNFLLLTIRNKLSIYVWAHQHPVSLKPGEAMDRKKFYKFYQTHGRKPTDQEMADILGCTLRSEVRLNRLKFDINPLDLPPSEEGSSSDVADDMHPVDTILTIREEFDAPTEYSTDFAEEVLRDLAEEWVEQDPLSFLVVTQRAMYGSNPTGVANRLGVRISQIRGKYAEGLDIMRSLCSIYKVRYQDVKVYWTEEFLREYIEYAESTFSERQREVSGTSSQEV